MTMPSPNGLHADLDALASLDSAIQPLSQPAAVNRPLHNVFLTGATGFVGAFLLQEILENSNAQVYALVRANDTPHGLQRIQQNLAKYLIWKPTYEARVIPVPGDLKHLRFGLGDQDFQFLADKVDAIYHCGSKLSYVAPYEYLQAANVRGTEETLRMVTMRRAPGPAAPVHLVGSLGIFLAYNDLQGGQEGDELDASKCPPVGYFQTKYVSEKVVRMARDRGIPVSIHRIGLIVGDSRTGVSNMDDFVARMLIGCIQVGYAPDVKNFMDMTPVDYVSRAMYYLTQQQSTLGSVFHLLNPDPIHWSDIFDMVIEAGYPVEKLPFNQWVEAVEEHEDPSSNPLHPLLPFFHIPFARRMLGVNESGYRALGTAATQHALKGSGITCPRIDRKIIRTFLTQFAEMGRLDKVSQEV